MVIAGALLVAVLEIYIAPARTQIVPQITDLRMLCRTDRDIRACTDFRGQVLTCKCHRRGEQWHIAARAQLIPYVYLSAPRESLAEHVEVRRAQLGRRHVLGHVRGQRGEVADAGPGVEHAAADVPAEQVERPAVVRVERPHPLERLEVLPLRGRSFHYKPLAATGDSVNGMVVGEYTLEVRNENAHGVLKGLAF